MLGSASIFMSEIFVSAGLEGKILVSVLVSVSGVSSRFSVITAVQVREARPRGSSCLEVLEVRGPESRDVDARHHKILVPA